MKYRYVGNTGLLVSRVCLGTMTFGMEKWGCDKETSIKLTDMFINEGGNFIDTADRYSFGIAESIVGEALREKKRDDIVLATKCFLRMDDKPNARGLSRKYIISACEASLKRLGTDYIDLYQMHGPDPRTPMEESLKAFDDLVRQGKVRYIGCSNFFSWQILKANGISGHLNLEKFSCAQHLYNLIVRDVEREILPACIDQGMGFICWSPLAGGLLTGKYKRADKPEEGTRLFINAEYEVPLFWYERAFSIAEEVSLIADKTGKTCAQIALSWLLRNKHVTSVIIGVRTIDQLKDNLTPGEWDLPEDYWKQLDVKAHFDHGYPRRWMDSVFKYIYGDEEF